MLIFNAFKIAMLKAYLSTSPPARLAADKCRARDMMLSSDVCAIGLICATWYPLARHEWGANHFLPGQYDDLQLVELADHSILACDIEHRRDVVPLLLRRLDARLAAQLGSHNCCLAGMNVA